MTQVASRRTHHAGRAVVVVLTIAALAAGLLPGTATARRATSTEGSIARDGWGRTTTSGWGTSEGGHPWSIPAMPETVVANGTSGIMAISGAGDSRSVHLSNFTASDVDVAVDVRTSKMPKGWGQVAWVVGRRVSGTAEYRARMRIAANGTIWVAATRLDGSYVEQLVGPEVETGGKVGRGDPVRVRFQVTGSPARLAVKAWPALEAEPAAWAVQVTDSTAALQGAGSVGLRAAVPANSGENQVVRFAFDNFVVMPVARPTATFASECEDLACTVDGSASTSPNGGVTSWHWTFGDGSTATGPTASHAYAGDGTYRITLTVTDALGLTATFARDVSVTAPVEEPVDDRTFGAAPVGTTRYPVPAGAKFVSPSGSDSNAGTETAPWRTLAKAVAASPAGSTIVLRGGTYREQVSFYAKALTIQSYPGEAVWLNGSQVVTGWVRDGATWRKDGWTYRFNGSSVGSEWIDPAYPLAARPDQVFVDGVARRQVGSLAQVGPGTFWVDEANSRLHIGDDPTGRTVEASFLSYGIWVNHGDGSVIRGIGFRHYASDNTYGAALRAYADRMVVENCHFVDNAWAGASVLGHDTTFRRNTARGNGNMGLHTWQNDRLVVEGNHFAGNNTERFAAWASGGTKLAEVADTVVRDNLVEGNVASDGIWVDVSSIRVSIVRNVVRGNGRHGIEYEISAQAVIAANVVVDNAGYGIYVTESHDIEVWNNTILRNAWGIRIWDGSRATGFPDVTWVTDDVTVRNNVLGGGRSAVVSVDDSTRQKSGNQMVTAMSHNAYWRPPGPTPSIMTQWPLVAGSVTNYGTLDQFRSATGQEATSWCSDGTSANPLVADEAGGDYRLPATHPAAGRGYPLPAAVAAAIGVAAGTAVSPGVLYVAG